MTKTQALRYLQRAEHFGFVAYHHGLISCEAESRHSGNITGLSWGINIECHKIEGHLFSHPQIIWDADQAERMFPGKTKKL